MTSSHALLTLLMCALGSSLMTLENARGARDCDAVHAEGSAERNPSSTSTLANYGCGRFANGSWGGADGFCASELERPWSAARSARRLAMERLWQPTRPATPERGGLTSALAAVAFSAPTATLRGSLWIAAQSAAPQTWQRLETLGWNERARVAGRIWAADWKRTVLRPTEAISATWLGVAADVSRPAWQVVACTVRDMSVAVRSGLDLADAKFARTLALVRCREWLAAAEKASANARPLTHWRAKRPRVVGVRPGDAGQALSAAAVRLQTLAAESLSGVGNTMLDLAGGLRKAPVLEAKRAPATIEKQARKTGFLEL